MKRFREYILEQPYDAEMPMPSKESDKGWNDTTSDRALKDRFTHLFDIEDYKVYMNNITPQVRVYTKFVKPTGEQTNLEIAYINFKKNPTIKIPNKLPYQVDLAKISPLYRDKQIMSRVYIGLAKMGYFIVSDTTQYTGGKELWKRISKDIAHGLFVYIWDETKSKYYCDDTGKPIQYNSKNIPDDHIWSTGMDFSKSDIVLTIEPVIS